MRNGAYLPSCDWQRLGLAGFERGKAGALHWFRFAPPHIDGKRATVRLAVMGASRAGEGRTCRFDRRGQRWRLRDCTRDWSS
ncbi:hypothetical protein ACOYW6_05825 [Parablastomonas sp. CN1-191]|uniref:hypothetical protein n=1 Tax=Parablastomonas sp. CN1-191 TaxID=3400908 RepID=UPI003BF7F31C